MKKALALIGLGIVAGVLSIYDVVRTGLVSYRTVIGVGGSLLSTVSGLIVLVFSLWKKKSSRIRKEDHA